MQQVETALAIIEGLIKVSQRLVLDNNMRMTLQSTMATSLDTLAHVVALHIHERSPEIERRLVLLSRTFTNDQIFGIFSFRSALENIMIRMFAAWPDKVNESELDYVYQMGCLRECVDKSCQKALIELDRHISKVLRAIEKEVVKVNQVICLLTTLLSTADHYRNLNPEAM